MKPQNLLFIVIFAVCFCVNSNAQKDQKDDWQRLFDGKSLQNFIQLNGTAMYKVENEAIVGVSRLNTPNSFLE